MRAFSIFALLAIMWIFSPYKASAQKYTEIQAHGYIAGMGYDYWSQHYGFTANVLFPVTNKVSIGAGASIAAAGKYVHYSLGDATNIKASMYQLMGKIRFNALSLGKFRLYVYGNGGLLSVTTVGDDYIAKGTDNSFTGGVGTGISVNIGKGLTFQIIETEWDVTKPELLGMDRSIWSKYSTGINFQIRKK